MYHALKEGHGPAGIAHYVRTNTKRKSGHCFYVNGGKDQEYQDILNNISRIDKDIKSDRFNDPLNANEDSMDLKANKMHAAALKRKT